MRALVRLLSSQEQLILYTSVCVRVCACSMSTNTQSIQTFRATNRKQQQQRANKSTLQSSIISPFSLLPGVFLDLCIFLFWASHLFYLYPSPAFLPRMDVTVA